MILCLYVLQDIRQRGQQQEHPRNRFCAAQEELRKIQVEGTCALLYNAYRVYSRDIIIHMYICEYITDMIERLPVPRDARRLRRDANARQTNIYLDHRDAI